MPAVVFFIIIIVLVLIMTVTWIPWRNVFISIWGNNPLKAKIYIESGEQIDICNGKYAGDTKDGLLYEYKYKKLSAVVFVPFRYPYRYIFGRRKVRVIWGQAHAAPLGGMTQSSVGMTGVTLDNILRARIGAELVKSVFGKAINYMLIMIIIGAFIIGGIFMYNKYIKSPEVSEPAPAQGTPAQQPPVQPLPGGDWPEG